MNLIFWSKFVRRRLDVVTLAGFSDHGDDQEERGPSLGDRILTKTEGAVAGRARKPRIGGFNQLFIRDFSISPRLCAVFLYKGNK